jgi:hypothetical protein
MNVEKTIEKLEARINELEIQVGTLRDVEAIKKLQRAYGYYLEHWRTADIVELFSKSPEVCVKANAGEFRGPESVKWYYYHGGDPEKEQVVPPPDFFYQVMQLSPIIDVAPDRQRAWGRWYGFGANAFPVKGGVAPGWLDGVYENEYIKEDGKWKILKLHWFMYFDAPFALSWVKPEKRVDMYNKPDFKLLKPDGPAEDTEYPSGFQAPYHYKNPVTGK